MPYRKPKFAASHDENHYIVRDFMRDACGGFEKHMRGVHPVYTCNYHGVAFSAVDTSGLGGPFLDWIISSSSGTMFVEVKTPESFAKMGHDLTENEHWHFDNMNTWRRVICDDDGVRYVFENLL